VYAVALWWRVDTRAQEHSLLYDGRIDSAVVEEVIDIGSSNEIKGWDV